MQRHIKQTHGLYMYRDKNNILKIVSVIKIKIWIILTTWCWRILEYNLLVYHCLSYMWVIHIETLHLNNEGLKICH
jgi:hypothetical protein